MRFTDILRESAKRVRRIAQPVAAVDLLRAQPISRKFGLDRGTAIDRRYIEAFLSANRECIRGRAMEVAESKYVRMFGDDRVTAVEVLHADRSNRHATLIGDLSVPSTLPENWVDCFVCTQTLNFIYDFHGAIRGLHRMLTAGGTALVTLAGVSQISRYDMDRWGDYWRFTTLSATRSFEAVFGPEIQVASHGNVLAATAFLQGLAVQDLPDPSVLDEIDPDYQLIITVLAHKR